MSVAFTVARLNATVTGQVISGTTSGSTVVQGTGAVGVVTNEALAICHAITINGAGNITLRIQGSVDGGTTWVTQGTFGVISATGIKTVRMTNVPPMIRWDATLNSGTSVVCIIDVIGVYPTDSTFASDTAVVAA